MEEIMVYLNFAIVEGNITRDGEVRHIAEGSYVTSFTLANNESFVNSKSETVSKANFIHVEIWGEAFAEKVSAYLKKGTPVRVHGKIRSDSWTSDDGTKKERIFVRGASVDFIKYAGNGNKQVEIRKKDSDLDCIDIIESEEND